MLWLVAARICIGNLSSPQIVILLSMNGDYCGLDLYAEYGFDMLLRCLILFYVVCTHAASLQEFVLKEEPSLTKTPGSPVESHPSFYPEPCSIASHAP